MEEEEGEKEGEGKKEGGEGQTKKTEAEAAKEDVSGTDLKF